MLTFPLSFLHRHDPGSLPSADMSYYPSFLDEETEVQSPVRHQQSKPLASLVLRALNLRGSYLGVSCLLSF